MLRKINIEENTIELYFFILKFERIFQDILVFIFIYCIYRKRLMRIYYKDIYLLFFIKLVRKLTS